MSQCLGVMKALNPLLKTWRWAGRREWGVKVVDWHTQHSTLAGAAGLSSKLKRLFPIVGCEADAVAFEEQETQTLRTQPDAAGEAKTVRELPAKPRQFLRPYDAERLGETAVEILYKETQTR